MRQRWACSNTLAGSLRWRGRAKTTWRSRWDQVHFNKWLQINKGWTAGETSADRKRRAVTCAGVSVRGWEQIAAQSRCDPPLDMEGELCSSCRASSSLSTSLRWTRDLRSSGRRLAWSRWRRCSRGHRWPRVGGGPCLCAAMLQEKEEKIVIVFIMLKRIVPLFLESKCE